MASITCPYCWQEVDVEDPEVLDPDYPAPDLDYVVDCEICCRPIRILVNFMGDGQIDISAEPES